MKLSKTPILRLVGTIAMLGLAASPAAATSITPTDLSTLGLTGGDSTGSTSSDDVMELGILDVEVFLKGGLYTYVLGLTANQDLVSEFNTGFDPAGFNGVAGWDYGDAMTAGLGVVGTGAGAFTIELDPDGTIDWELVTPISGADKFFDDTEVVRFFYQSTFGPGAEQNYNVINGLSGPVTGLAPVPEPGAVTLFGIGLLVTGLALRRARH